MNRLALITAACLAASIPPLAAGTGPERVTSASLVGNDGRMIGEVTARQGPNGVLLQLRARELAPGWHGMHLHTHGTCADTHGFINSGGHVAADGSAHGLLNPDGPHEGDLANVFVHQDGQAMSDQYLFNKSLSDLANADGTALVIHANPDDYHSQPVGNAGSRIACAAFKPDSDPANQ